jgi:uncharacterized membrane protein
MSTALIGVIIGLVFGVVMVWVGVGQAFLVLFFGLLGWVIAKIAAREIDLVSWIERLSGRQQ